MKAKGKKANNHANQIKVTFLIKSFEALGKRCRKQCVLMPGILCVWLGYFVCFGGFFGLDFC